MVMNLEDELKTLRYAMELVEKQRDGLRRECENLARAHDSAVSQRNLMEKQRDNLALALNEAKENQDQNIKLINELKRELKAQGRETVLEPGQEITITIKVGR